MNMNLGIVTVKRNVYICCCSDVEW